MTCEIIAKVHPDDIHKPTGRVVYYCRTHDYFAGNQEVCPVGYYSTARENEVSRLRRERDDALKEAQEQRHRAQAAEGNEALLRMHRIELLTVLSPFAQFAWILDQAKQPDKAAITSNFGTIGAALKGGHCRAAQAVYNRIRVDVQ